MWTKLIGTALGTLSNHDRDKKGFRFRRHDGGDCEKRA